MKKILGTYTPPAHHWVGDGFPVRSLFDYEGLGRHLSPFLLLDHAGPTRFPAATQKRGVGQHPHRGFETVTIVYEGELEHRDSTGAGGTIGPGDVQWMTAAGGIMHEEFHSEAFTRTGGVLEMMQLWVNLPAKHKMDDAGYQTLTNADIPVVNLEAGGKVRVIAGDFDGNTGAARTHSPIDVWDIHLNAGSTHRIKATAGHTLAVVVVRGTVMINGETIARDGQLIHFDRDGTDVVFEANNDAILLWLSGEPIDEPIVGYGPFVMNTEAEIHQAIADLRQGRFLSLSAA